MVCRLIWLICTLPCKLLLCISCAFWGLVACLGGLLSCCKSRDGNPSAARGGNPAAAAANPMRSQGTGQAANVAAAPAGRPAAPAAGPLQSQHVLQPQHQPQPQTTPHPQFANSGCAVKVVQPAAAVLLPDLPQHWEPMPDGAAVHEVVIYDGTTGAQLCRVAQRSRSAAASLQAIALCEAPCARGFSSRVKPRTRKCPCEQTHEGSFCACRQ